MSKIVISGYYGFCNAGDEAMLSAMIGAFWDLEPGVRITVISGNPKDTAERHGVQAVQRFDMLGIAKAVKEADLLISGGGSLLQDVTSNRSLYYYLSIMWLAKRLGTPVMLYGQGIGPINGKIARAVTRRVCRQASLITVRDDGSRKELLALGIDRPEVTVTADPVLGMHPVSPHAGRLVLRRYGMEGAKLLIGIAVRQWKNLSDYKGQLAQAADALIRRYNARIVFLPMQIPDDVLVSRSILQQMQEQKSASILSERFSTTEFLSIVGNLDMLIGVRLHALIFGAVMQIPVIGLSYDPKIERFLASIGEQPVTDLETVTAQAVLDKVATFWPEESKRVNPQLAYTSRLREQAFYNAELALTLMQPDGRR